MNVTFVSSLLRPVSARRVAFPLRAVLGLLCAFSLLACGSSAPAPTAPPTFVPPAHWPPPPGAESAPKSFETKSLGTQPPYASQAAPATDAPPQEWLGEQVEDTDASALQDFRPHLDPYGEWIEHPSYGTVWVPYEQSVGTRFVPYLTAGRWALTPDDQWVWVSDYAFGPVVFHYGRWVHASGHGWVWVPGRRYSHAWVTFRLSERPYVGWAPMPPSFIWRSGVAVPIHAVPDPAFVFVPYDYAFYSNVHSYAIVHPYHVHFWMAHSWPYWPPGALVGFYYCPPLHYVPVRARPSGRRGVEARAAQLARYRRAAQELEESAEAAVEGDVSERIPAGALRAPSEVEREVRPKQSLRSRPAPAQRVEEPALTEIGERRVDALGDKLRASGTPRQGAQPLEKGVMRPSSEPSARPQRDLAAKARAQPQTTPNLRAATVAPRRELHQAGRADREPRRPEAQKPEAKKPEAQKPEAQKLEARKPEAQKPEAHHPDPRKPEAHELRRDAPKLERRNAPPRPNVVKKSAPVVKISPPAKRLKLDRPSPPRKPTPPLPKGNSKKR